MKDGVGTAESSELSRREQAEENILMGLRLREGLCLRHITEGMGFTLEADVLQRFTIDGLIEQSTTSLIRTTKRGQLLLNAIVTNLADSLTEATTEGSAAG